MTCKDCIYRAMCYKHEHYGYGDEYNEEPCEMFKNKADFVEVRHGEWILHPDGSATCNQCKTHQLLIWDMDRSQNFCGHCGAKMDGGKAE